MFIALRYLLSTLLLTSIFAQQPESPSSRLLNETAVPQPEAAPANGSGDAAFWLQMAAQVRNELVHLAEDGQSILPELAIAAADDEHPFWMWLAAQMEEEFDNLGLDNTDILQVPSRVEYDAAVAREKEHPFATWIASILAWFF
ncbi:hypothetical protein FOL46_008493 [Perkinsus olseni]|uniref:Uncharacterized protein n=1 Tax=Perkinsus olseni TaxID=32597 RepID=A0A7J6L6M9_PEROL|nr:hypothetical protein FOL46_008493 [Perkinsus olseni]